MRRSRWMASLVILLACSGSPHGGSTSSRPSIPCITGLLRNTGTEGVAQLALREDNGTTTILVGDERDTLLQLTGAVVTVCGPTATEMMRPGMRVESWTLRSVDGQEAYLGRLLAGDGDLSLEPRGVDESRVVLSGVSNELRDFVGQTVWVAGRWSGSRFEVRAFGVVR